MGRAGQVIINDLGFEQYTQNIRELSKYVVKAGYPENGELKQGDNGDEEGASSLSEIAMIALANEFGTDKIPERSFIRSAIDESKGEIEDLKAQLAQRVAVGQLTAKQALKALGVRAVGLIKNKIIDIDSPPNAPLTVAIKGFDNPLIRSGQMKNSTQFVIDSKKGV